MNNIIVLAHKFLPQPDDDLVAYLNEKHFDNVLHIYHSFSDAPDRISYLLWYKRGKLYRTRQTWDFKWMPESLLHLKELMATLWWVLETHVFWNKLIGMDGLCVNFGLFLKLVKKTDYVIYWAVDFVPQKRFNQGWKNFLYHLINKVGYHHADEMWDISPRMAEARKKFLHIEERVYKKRKVVPYGMWLERMKTYSYQNCEKNTLVFMGHLLEKQGVQLVLRAIPMLIKKKPDLIFKIIGTGQYAETLKRLTKDLKIEKHCKFMGKISDSRVMEEEIAKSAVAVAPYIKSIDTWTYYADPGKIKNYLACGVPVLLTNVPWNTLEIVKAKCGRVISEQQPDIIHGILELMDSKKNQLYRDNARDYARTFGYESIFQGLDL